MSDNSTISPSGDVIRDIDRLTAGVKTQVFQPDLGGGNGNAEVLLTAGRKPAATSAPVVLSNEDLAALIQPIVDCTAALSYAIELLANPFWIDQASGRMRVLLDATGGAQTLGTVTTVGSITSVGILANAQTFGGVTGMNFFMDAETASWVQAVRARVS